MQSPDPAALVHVSWAQHLTLVLSACLADFNALGQKSPKSRMSTVPRQV